MRAALWYGKNDIRVLDVNEPPSPEKGEVKIKVKWCGICGSDLHEYSAGPIFIPVEKPHPLTGTKAPLILGHEFSGEVVDIGGGVDNVSVRDRVTIQDQRGCGECFWCLQKEYNLCDKLAFTGLMVDGAFAEYINVPAYCCYKLPDGVTYEKGALVEPLAVGMHAIKRSLVKPDHSMVIIGAGMIGLGVLKCALACGISNVIVLEKSKKRKEFAKKFGATLVIDSNTTDPVYEVSKTLGGRGSDNTIECVGCEETIKLAIDVTKKGGNIVIVGVSEASSTFNFNELVFTEKNVSGSLSYNKEFKEVIALMEEGSLRTDNMVTRKIKLENIEKEGFEELLHNKDDNIKILVSPE